MFIAKVRKLENRKEVYFVVDGYEVAHVNGDNNLVITGAISELITNRIITKSKRKYGIATVLYDIKSEMVVAEEAVDF